MSGNKTTGGSVPFRIYGFDQVNVSFLNDTCSATVAKTGEVSKKTHPEKHPETSKTLPLVLSPRWDSSMAFLCGFLHANHDWVNEQIVKYGAVLIRGFEIDGATDFEKAVLAVQPELCDAYRGTSPRSLMPGTKYAFSAADVPVTYPIAQHLEMSFLKAPPRQLYFGCLKASSKPGGETSLCDFRKVYQDLSPKLRQKLQDKKIKYTRRHYKVGEKYTYDVGAMLSWPQLFGTDSKEEVEAITAEEGAPAVKWVGPDEDTFLQEWVDEPFQVHPDTGEMVWFNHSQVFHWTTFPCELWYAYRRVGDWHLLVHFFLLSVYCFIKYGLLGYTMALNTSFGGGEPISFAEMSEIRAAVHKNMVFSRWRKGDILCIDNFSTSHGRQPTYDKGRKVIVAWSHPMDKTGSASEVDAVASETVSNEMSTTFNKDAAVADTDDVPDLSVITPDTSPESTLSSVEAQVLQDKLQKTDLGAALYEKLVNETSRRSHRSSQASARYGHRSLNSCPDLLSAGSSFWSNENPGATYGNDKTEKIE